MNNDRVLIAVNALIAWYEEQTTSSISLENESNLDILQISNLHKVEMFLNGFELSNALDIMQNIKEEKAANTTPKQEEYSGTTSPEYEDCITVPFVSDKERIDSFIENRAEDINDFNSSVKKTKAYKGYAKGYKKPGEKLDKFRREYNNRFEDLFDKVPKSYDLEDCFNCKQPIASEIKLPPFEIAWELKQFLRNIRELLHDIRLSLDSTQLAADLCNFLELGKKNKFLCTTSYPLLAIGFPIIINKSRAELMELGFSWTGIVGPIITPVLNGATYIAEVIKSMTDPIFECILNAFRSFRLAFELVDTSIDRSIGGVTAYSSYLNDAPEQKRLAEQAKEKLKEIEASKEKDSIEKLFERIDAVKATNQGAQVESKEEVEEKKLKPVLPKGKEKSKIERFKELEQEQLFFEMYRRSQSNDPTYTRILDQESSEESTSNLEVNEFEEDGFKADYIDLEENIEETKPKAKPKQKSESSFRYRIEKPYYHYAGGQLVSRDKNKSVRLLEGSGLLSTLRYLESQIVKARDFLDEYYAKFIYLMKSFTRLVVEPIYASNKLIAEIKVAFNFIRFISLVVNLIDRGLDNICDSFNTEENQSLLTSILQEEFDDIDVEFDNSETENTIAKVKSKTSNYQTRLVPNDCGEVLVKVNDKQTSIDLIYDKIVNELG